MDTRNGQRTTGGGRTMFLPWVLILLAALGCGMTSGIQGQGALQSPAAEKEIPLNTQVTVNSTSLARDLAVTELKSAYAGDILRAAASVTSQTSATLTLQYRFVWYDAKGWELEPEAGTWTPLVLYGKDSRQLQGVAPNNAAKAFKIKIRR